MTFFEFAAQMSIGLVLAGATVGSALGIGAAGRAATGAWAKEAQAGKPLNFSYIILIGMPLSQTIYGFILMLVGISPLVIGESPLTTQHAGTLVGVGLAGGLGEFFSAWIQGLIPFPRGKARAWSL